MKKLVVTVAREGGLYSPFPDESAPIRIYSDRWVHDRFFGRRRRERLSEEQFANILKIAEQNAGSKLVPEFVSEDEKARGLSEAKAYRDRRRFINQTLKAFGFR